MTDANSRQVALQNLREFQEMSYYDVYALIRQKSFKEATEKYSAVLESMGYDEFNAAFNLQITTPHDNLLEAMSAMASGVSEPEKIRAVSFDLSAHVIYHDEAGQLQQGIEVSLYSEDVYDFSGASDDQIRDQCEKAASDWQGCFMEINSVALEGLGSVAQQFQHYAENQNNLEGIIENQDGIASIDPLAIARHVAKLLVAVEYHRYMAEFVSEVEVPSQMVFIIGEHDEIEVPIVFYRVGEKTLDMPLVESVAEPVATVQEELIPAEPVQELQHEETPAMYHPSVEEQYVEEPSAQLYEADSEVERTEEVAEIVETVEVEQPAEFSIESPDSPLSQEIEETPEQEPTPGEKARLGISLEPKVFGQRSNDVFNDEAAQKTN